MQIIRLKPVSLSVLLVMRIMMEMTVKHVVGTRPTRMVVHVLPNAHQAEESREEMMLILQIASLALGIPLTLIT
jgi:hypothetical protein